MLCPERQGVAVTASGGGWMMIPWKRIVGSWESWGSSIALARDDQEDIGEEIGEDMTCNDKY